MAWKNGRSKPVIGIIGGIGSGKSTVSRLFAREGLAVIDADQLAHQVLQSDEIKTALRNWLGQGVFEADGTVNRRAVGRVVFRDGASLDRLNKLIHPRVGKLRDERMVLYLGDPSIRGVVWDIPLLIEAGLAEECDALVFVKVPRNIRLDRLRQSRGWGGKELDRREKMQIPLDKKAELADYCIDNSGDEAASLHQVQRILSHLLASPSQSIGKMPFGDARTSA